VALYERNVPVHYLGGPLSGEINDQDYGFYEELEPGWVFDYPTRSWTGGYPVGAQDTVERYVLEQQGERWVFVHTGTFTQPIEDTAFYITLVGGEQDGAREYVLGGARRWEGGPIPLFPGRVLRHVGDDPVEGWEAHDG
jgi:hypothetical protein